ncbi:hypothetical protein Salat_0475800 [Sesamum alatum]|uniref:RIN4 pathogenic type III effector avirulence factor Avr cleavage site domain-containing protein n=1 Tax=Sesamum alatum TaxID=300844 RepID=A0AAE2D142_9LAMI|nr:hypothetical protein Salat_0475800 [Sesamum alatum]
MKYQANEANRGGRRPEAVAWTLQEVAHPTPPHPTPLSNSSLVFPPSMENSRGKNRMSVPQFGGWDGKAQDETNYSVVFSQARANRKKHKSELPTRSSNGLGNEFELPNDREDVEPFSSLKNRKSVPQFGGWDGKTPSETNYSVVFSHARANRKKHKSELPTRNSLGNEFEFHTRHPHIDSAFSTMPKTRKTKAWFSCFAPH